MRKIAIQGICGSFHDIAAHQYFEGETLQLICCDSFEALFRAMHEDPSVLGLMAIENTIAGSLLHNYELLRESGVRIIGEHKLHIEHSLLCLPEDDPADIVEVNSHPVALAQCHAYLANRPALKVVQTDDTAGAAAAISQQQLHGHAAICHADAAALYGLKVIDRAIEDNKHNYTRFLLLATLPEDAPVAEEGADKASLVFALPHEEGSLSQVLSIFSFYRINLTKIQSLPIIGREWEYLFYIDVCYDEAQRFHQSIQAVTPLTRELRVLGEYRGK